LLENSRFIKGSCALRRIPFHAGFISVAAGGYDPAIQKDLTKVSKTSNAPEGCPQSGNRSSMQRKIQGISI
jgi:hypothetical protein